MVNLVLDMKPTDIPSTYMYMDSLVWGDIWVELCLKTLQVSKELNNMKTFQVSKELNKIR